MLLSPLLFKSSIRVFFYALARRMICPFREMEKHLKKCCRIADIGCGHGLFTLYVALKNPDAHIFGFDPNEYRLRIGKNAAKNVKNIHFICGYFESRQLFDAVCLSDVFHHLQADAQVDLVKKISKTLNPNGILLVKEICTNDGFRYSLSALSDRLLYPLDQTHFRSKSEWKQLFVDCGFFVTHKRVWYLPFSTNLFIAQKRVQ